MALARKPGPWLVLAGAACARAAASEQPAEPSARSDHARPDGRLSVARVGGPPPSSSRARRSTTPFRGGSACGPKCRRIARGLNSNVTGTKARTIKGTAGRAGSAHPRRAETDRRLLARIELPVGRADLPARRSVAPDAAEIAHVKPRLLGHWGTTPGLNFVYVHLDRVIKAHDLSVVYIAGPGHGGPALVANVYLEGTYTETYPNISQDEEGMKRLFVQFSFPGGIPSHVAPETPGSIHEGGELGYALSHAFGAVFDNPDLVAASVIGDGKAETGALATSWHSNKFLNPQGDGAVLPILHLNGYKIANPTVLARIPREELDQLLRGYGYEPHYVEGHDPSRMHLQMASALDAVVGKIRAIQRQARSKGFKGRPRWPMIVLRSPKGWTCPKSIDGKLCEDYWRSHQVPMGEMDKPGHVKVLETWLKSYRPEELFDESGRFREELAALAPPGERRMGANPHANGGLLLKELRLPAFQKFAVEVRAPGAASAEATTPRPVDRRSDEAESRVEEFPRVQSRRERVEPVAGHLRRHEAHVCRRNPSHRRQPRAGRPRHGDAVGAPVPGLAGRLPAHRPSRLLQLLRGVHPHHRLDVQPARQVAESVQPHRLAASNRVAQLPPLEPRLAPGPQRLQPPGSGLHQSRGHREANDPGVPAARRELPPARHRPLPPQSQSRQRGRRRQAAGAQWLTMEQAIKHCDRGIGIWEWASNDRGGDPDVVMACAGDVPTLETLAAVDLLRNHVAELKVRVVNVVDLMTLQPPREHPSGLSDGDFDALFTKDRPVVFAFHGYPWLIHRLTYRRTNHDNFHVRGYREEGTRTAPSTCVC